MPPFRPEDDADKREYIRSLLFACSVCPRWGAQDTAERERFAAETELQAISDPTLIPYILEATGGYLNSFGRESAYHALRRIGKTTGDPSIPAFFIEELHKRKTPGIRQTLLLLLEDVITAAQHDSALPLLHELLSCPNRSVREYSAAVLGKIGDSRSVVALLEGLSSAKHPEEVAAHLKGLKSCGDSTLLGLALDNALLPNWGSCQQAVECISDWLGSDAEPILLYLMKCKRPASEFALRKLALWGTETAYDAVLASARRVIRRAKPRPLDYPVPCYQAQYLARFPHRTEAEEVYEHIRLHWKDLHWWSNNFLLETVPQLADMKYESLGEWFDRYRNSQRDTLGE